MDVRNGSEASFFLITLDFMSEMKYNNIMVNLSVLYHQGAFV